jgi:hypothetical protein
MKYEKWSYDIPCAIPNYRKRELPIIKCILMLTININSDKM